MNKIAPVFPRFEVPVVKDDTPDGRSDSLLPLTRRMSPDLSTEFIDDIVGFPICIEPPTPVLTGLTNIEIAPDEPTIELPVLAIIFPDKKCEALPVSN